LAKIPLRFGTGREPSRPKRSHDDQSRASRAARARVRTGAGPWLRLVPPTCSASSSVTSAPSSRACSAAAAPAGPPPTTSSPMALPGQKRPGRALSADGPEDGPCRLYPVRHLRRHNCPPTLSRPPPTAGPGEVMLTSAAGHRQHAVSYPQKVQGTGAVWQRDDAPVVTQIGQRQPAALRAGRQSSGPSRSRMARRPNHPRGLAGGLGGCLHPRARRHQGHPEFPARMTLPATWTGIGSSSAASPPPEVDGEAVRSRPG
jgi:hypothetical protein